MPFLEGRTMSFHDSMPPCNRPCGYQVLSQYLGEFIAVWLGERLANMHIVCCSPPVPLTDITSQPWSSFPLTSVSAMILDNLLYLITTTSDSMQLFVILGLEECLGFSKGQLQPGHNLCFRPAAGSCHLLSRWRSCMAPACVLMVWLITIWGTEC